MSYDYSSAGATLELPNPYKVQNLLLFLSGGTLVVFGVLALLAARTNLAAIPLSIGMALLFAGLLALGVAAKRLRFFFGRGRPHSLAPELQATMTGTSPAADGIKRLLREGALTYPEPSGAVDGVLYHWVPKLITAPIAIQDQARSAFFNACAMVPLRAARRTTPRAMPVVRLEKSCVQGRGVGLEPMRFLQTTICRFDRGA